MSSIVMPPKSLLWAVNLTKLIPWLTRKVAGTEDTGGIILIPERTAFRLKSTGENTAVLYVGGGEKGLNNVNWTIAKLNAIYPARVMLRLVPATKTSYTTIVIDASTSLAYSQLIAHPPYAPPVDYVVRAENVVA